MIQDFTKHLFKNLADKDEVCLGFLGSFLKSRIFNHFLVILHSSKYDTNSYIEMILIFQSIYV